MARLAVVCTGRQAANRRHPACITSHGRPSNAERTIFGQPSTWIFSNEKAWLCRNTHIQLLCSCCAPSEETMSLANLRLITDPSSVRLFPASVLLKQSVLTVSQTKLNKIC